MEMLIKCQSIVNGVLIDIRPWTPVVHDPINVHAVFLIPHVRFCTPYGNKKHAFNLFLEYDHQNKGSFKLYSST